MAKNRFRIGVVAPSSSFDRENAAKVTAISDALFGAKAPEILFHPQCFAHDHHFAGSDALRAEAFSDYANDPAFDAIWFARGGYGACRIAHRVLPALARAAKAKTYLGYSDAGMLLAGLYKAGCSVAHGPMCNDVSRKGGEAAIERALRWLVERDTDALEPSLATNIETSREPDRPAAAFNMIVLSQIIGTPLEPDLTGHVLMLEEVSEYAYAIDRTMHHIAAHFTGNIAGIRLGRCLDILENDPEFGHTLEQIVRHWCEIFSIPFLGPADIGHDAANRIVPFGLPAEPAG